MIAGQSKASVRRRGYSGDCVMKKLIVAATLAAFGAGVVLPAAPIIGSSGAFAAQKSSAKAKKKKSAKAKPKAKAGSTM